ncbi:MAG: acyl-CoA dehydrogenase [Rhodobacteraceae bacterium]|nr:acyl-CoA dehydrogenase [Paracoccaceae bacterium]
MTIADLDATDIDRPIFDPAAFRLTEQEAELTSLARRVARTRFAPRAEQYDREATFPTQNYRDMHEAGLLGICVPKENGGHGAPFRAYMMTAAEIGRYCGATALTWNMHVCSCLWTGALTDDLDMSAAERELHLERRARHYARILDDGAIYSQPFSEGGAAAAGAAPFSTSAKQVDGGWLINGKKIFASLSGHADYYGILCGEMKEGEKPSRRDTMYIAVPARAEGVEVVGDWDPLGMRGTVSRTLIFKDVFVPDDEQLMPRGIYYQAASRWPHMFMTLSPTYMGIAQAAYDFTIKYLRGEWPGLPPVKRRMFPTKQMGVAQMQLMLEQTKALWFQAITEAGPDPSREQMMRAWAAHYTVMENANEICQLAVRTCGGQSMLKTLPLERLYRDSRCGSLMLPWTAEICLDRIGRESLYLPGESDA